MIKPHNDISKWVLGTPFNRAYYSIFNYQNNMMGFIGMPLSDRTFDPSRISEKYRVKVPGASEEKVEEK